MLEYDYEPEDNCFYHGLQIGYLSVALDSFRKHSVDETPEECGSLQVSREDNELRIALSEEAYKRDFVKKHKGLHGKALAKRYIAESEFLPLCLLGYRDG